jgi:hypothetical protein
MKYLDFLIALDLLSRYYPRYHANEILMLADDILKWLNNELPDDSSTVIYLKQYFGSPGEALQFVWKEIQLLANPYVNLN